MRTHTRRTAPRRTASQPTALRRTSRRDFARLVGLGVTGAALPGLSGCSALSADSTDSATLRATFVQAINDLDPYGPSTIDEATLLAGRLIYDTLVRRGGTEFEPGLARSWEQQDETTWIFHLREDVVFHDGSSLTTRDVVASIERIREAETAQAPLWEPVEEARDLDPRTVRLRTAEPLGTLLANLTLLFILPADRVEEEGFFQRPIGSGPFEVASFTPAAELHLVPSPRYWDTPPEVEDLRLPFIPEVSSQVTALRTGEIDALWPLPPDQLDEVQGQSGIRVETVPGWAYYLHWFNCGREPFTDPRVRRAMWRAVDVRGIVERLFGDRALPMTAPIPSAVFGYAEQDPFRYDPDRARRELADAGLPDGFRTSLMWFDTTGPLARELAQALISEWAKIGVEVEPLSLEKAEWMRRLNALEWDMQLQINTVTTGDADFTLGRLYDSEADRLGYANPELDEVLREARRVTDQDRRAELYARACTLIWNDGVGIFPAEMISTYGLRDRVEGFDPVPSDQPDMREVRVDQRG